MRRPKVESAAEAKARAKKVDEVAKAMSMFQPAREVLSLVRSVPTVMVQFDHAIRTGGWPIEIITIAHGPSNHGKTAFALLLEKSFLDLGHFAFHIDAERSTPMDWVRVMIGANADSDRFKAIRPDSYEQAVEKTEEFCKAIKRLRDEGHVPDDTTGIVVVDSIRKLIPKDFFKAATKTDKADPMSGMGPMIKAKWNTAWMDTLTPLVDKTGTGFLAIGREYEDKDADEWAKKAGTAVKLGGGQAIVFDSSVVVRIDRMGWVGPKREKEDKGPVVVYGERHRITIRKTKVGGKDSKATTCFFHTSNGTLVPPGHDRARDVLDLATKFGITEVNGSWVKWGKNSIGQGFDKAVVALTKDASMLAALEAEVRESFASNAPEEHDLETGEVT